MARTPRYKNTRGDSFFGAYLFDLAVPRDHFLRALQELFDWEGLGQGLIHLYPGRGALGCPPYDPALLFKMLLLSYLYDLSERFVNENIPAHYFLDLALDQQAPDHSTLTTFKQRLVATGGWEELQHIFDEVLQHARERGLRLGRIQLVDSVHTQTDVNAQKDRARQERGQASRDAEARVVHQGEREVVEADGQKVKKEIRYRGYKTHVAMDAKSGLVTSLLPALGDSADNEAFAALFAHDLSLGLPTHTYGGDKAYDDTEIFERIEQQ